MKNIVLIGFMAVGKTTAGVLLAQKLGYNFIDLDKMIVEKQGKSICDIFEEHGEDYFRDLESEAVKDCAKINNSVISTGGGVVLRNENIKELRKNGIIVYLDANIDVILERLDDSTGRPLADGLEKQAIIDRFNKRKNLYEDCDFRVHIDENATPFNTVEKITEFLRG